jgi:hypothetical protein
MAPKIQDTEQVWHNDKHKLSLRINKSELEIMQIICPEEGLHACTNRDGVCVVQHFIGLYGLDCNGGVCPAQEHLEICWTLIGDVNDVESSQLWFIPLADEVFQAWIVSNQETQP